MMRSVSVRFASASVAVVCAAVLASCAKPEAPPPPPPKVVAGDVIQKDVPIPHEWVGQTLGSSDVTVRSRVQGIILGMHFQEGTKVAKDQLLYTVDPAEYAQKVASAEAQLAQAKTMLVKAQADLARFEPLAAMNAVSQRDLDAARASRDASADQVRSAEAMLEVAKIDLSYTRITAPIGGLIGISKFKVGDFVGPVGPTATLNTISDIDPIDVKFFVSESEYLSYTEKRGPMREARKGETPDLEMILADGSVHPHPGKVVKVDRGLDPTTGALAIEAEFPNPERRILPGQFAKVRAVIETRPGALLVPQKAVQQLQGRNFVFVLGAGDVVEMRRVTMGPRTGDLWLVDEGLKPGEKVVVEGGQRIRSGMKVAPASGVEPQEGR